MLKLLGVVAVPAVSTTHAGVVIHVDAGNCPEPGDGSEPDPYCSIQTILDGSGNFHVVQRVGGRARTRCSTASRSPAATPTAPVNNAVTDCLFSGNSASGAVQQDLA